MRVLKKIGKAMAVLFLVLILGLAALDLYLIKKPEIQAKRIIEGIDEAACGIQELTIRENAKIIGLGEATHGNAEFQELKLEVLKVLVDQFGVDCFAMEMDYGEGVIINDYINGHSEMSVNEVMNHISFPIYRTEEIRSLIEWMKEYNRSHSDKLSFYGFDMQNPDVDLNLILDFVEENSIEEGACLGAAFDSYLNGSANIRDAGLSDGFEALNRLKSQLETNRDTYQGLYNYDRILDCIENVMRARELASRYDGDNGMVEGGQYRDQMMAKKVIEISEGLDGSRMMVAGHNGHIGYAGNYDAACAAPSQALLRLLCYTACDLDMLLDTDESEDASQRYALVWPEIRRNAESMYGTLTARKHEFSRFRELVSHISISDRPPGIESPETLDELDRICVELFELHGEHPVLKDNLLWLLQIAESDPGLKKIKPLFLYRGLIRHRKRMENTPHFHLDYRTLWKRQEYNIEEDNGKNYRSHAKALLLFEALYGLFAVDDDVDIPMCMAGFEALSNLAEFYRWYPDENRLLPFGTSVEELFETDAYTCFEHGYGDNVIMEQMGVSVTKLNRFACGRLGHHQEALRRIHSYMKRNREGLVRKFLDTPSSEVASLCGSVLDSSLPRDKFQISEKDLPLFLAMVNSILMELTDDQAEAYLKGAAKLLCGEIEQHPRELNDCS